MRGVVVLMYLELATSCGSSRPLAPAPAAEAKLAAAPPVAAKPSEPVKPVIPDTAAGHTLTAWLDAFNSGDVPRMKEIAARYKDPMGFRIVDLREETGGYDLVAIEKSEPRSIKFVIKEKANASQSVVWLSVADGDPAVIETFTLVVIPPGKTAADIRTEIDAKTPARIVDGIEKALSTYYVYPELAKRWSKQFAST